MSSILPDLSQADRIAKLEAMVAAQAALLAQRTQAGRVTFKVSEKGCISLCGLQRFPVTLYASQWERILEHGDQLRAFIKAHPELARKA